MKVHRYSSFLLIVFLIFSITSCTKEDDHYTELSTLERKVGDRKAAQALHEKALALHKKKNYEKSERLWYEAAKADPSWWRPYYNLACVKALKGDSEKAIGYIDMALGVQYPKSILKSLKRDSDLNSIRDNPEYKNLIDNTFGLDRKNLLIGAWEYIEPQFRKGLPEKLRLLNGECLPSNYLLFRFDESGIFTMSEYASTETGKYEVKGEYIHYTITEEELEGRIIDGKKWGGKKKVSKKGSVKIIYLSEEFLCCAGEKEGTCYQKRNE